jgi:hypothetical protein
VGEKLRRRIIWAKESWVIHKNGYGYSKYREWRWGRVIVDPGRSTLCNFLSVVQKGTMAPFFKISNSTLWLLAGCNNSCRAGNDLFIFYS